MRGIENTRFADNMKSHRVSTKSRTKSTKRIPVRQLKLKQLMFKISSALENHAFDDIRSDSAGSVLRNLEKSKLGICTTR